MALVVVANEYALNPFLKELYAFPAKGGGIVPIVSYDGWNKMMIRRDEFDGIKFDFTDTPEGLPESCTATVYLKGRTHPVIVTEWLAECKRNTEPWNSMPRRMLRNRTLCQAARMAFGFSGVSNEDEAPNGATITVETSVLPTEPMQDRKLVAAPPTVTPQQELEAFVIGAGFTFSDLQKFGTETNNIEGADSLASFSEIPTGVATRLLKNKVGLLKIVGELKEGGAK